VRPQSKTEGAEAPPERESEPWNFRQSLRATKPGTEYDGYRCALPWRASAGRKPLAVICGCWS
jgi:hypothetical protein